MAAARPMLPRSIWALGFVSLFMDISSEMVHALLPVFLVTVLGANTVTVGIIEGIGEATASVCKLYSGWLSDRIGARKALTIVGYGLGALSKPLFAVAPTAPWVLFARFSDRIGKGIRGAPRDALVGDLAPPEIRGAAYGLRQSLDTVGAFAGPLLAIALMALFADDFRLVFWLAVIPGLIAVAILVLGVREPAQHREEITPGFSLKPRALAALGGVFWIVVAFATVLTLARFSEAFLILRAVERGLDLALAPTILIIMNAVYSVAAYPFGALSDKADKSLILTSGLGVLFVSDIVLALASNLWAVMAGVALWGLHMGMTQGLLAALVAEIAPPTSRGTAFGIFHLTTGLALLAASLIAGFLWDWIGPSATFASGAVFTAVSLVGFVAIGQFRKR